MVDYESLEDVLKELDIQEDELKRLVSEGTLRAYRDEGKMKFRKEDVEALKRANLGVGSAPAMTPTEAGEGLRVVEETDETIVDLNELSEDVDFEDTGETSVPTVDLTADDDEDATLTDELVFDDNDIDADADATLAMDEGLSLDDDIGLETEPLSDFDDADATMLDDGAGEIDLEGGDLQLDGGYAAGGFGGGGFAPPPMAAPQIQVHERISYVEILPSETIVTKIISAVILLLMIGVFMGSMAIATGKDSMGLGAKLFGMFNTTMKEANDGEHNKTPVKMSGDEPMKSSDAGYRDPNGWNITVTSDGVMFPGQSMVRKVGDGTALSSEELEEIRNTVTSSDSDMAKDYDGMIGN